MLSAGGGRAAADAGASREVSPEHWESADEGDATLEAAARVRLPTGSLSPEKRRSPSPDPFPAGGGDFGRTFGGVKKEDDRGVVPLESIPENPNNCEYFFAHVVLRDCRVLCLTICLRYPLRRSRRGPTSDGAV